MYILGGGSGFIGKSLCKALENAGYSVTIVSRKNDAGKKQVITWVNVLKYIKISLVKILIAL